jgi:hypothetical protein
MGSCKHSKEVPHCINDGKIPDQLNDCRVLKKSLASSSELCQLVNFVLELLHRGCGGPFMGVSGYI